MLQGSVLQGRRPTTYSKWQQVAAAGVLMLTLLAWISRMLIVLIVDMCHQVSSVLCCLAGMEHVDFLCVHLSLCKPYSV